jgi:hypothetical protein
MIKIYNKEEEEKQSSGVAVKTIKILLVFTLFWILFYASNYIAKNILTYFGFNYIL